MSLSTPQKSFDRHDSGIGSPEPTSTEIATAIRENSPPAVQEPPTAAETVTTPTNAIPTNEQFDGPVPASTELFPALADVNSVILEIRESVAQKNETPTPPAEPPVSQLIADDFPTTVSNEYLLRPSALKKRKELMKTKFSIEPMVFKKDEKGEEDDNNPTPLILPETETISCGKQHFLVDVKAFDKLPVYANGQYGTVRRYRLQESPRVEIAVKCVLRSAVQEVDILKTVATSERLSIVEYYCTLSEPDSSYMWICMEYLDASLLQFYQVMQELYKSLGVPWEELDLLLFRILHNCVDGLSHLQNKGYAHRDIKPANLLINWGSMVKLCDFGISISLEKLQLENTREKGTESYIPSRRARDIRDDMWSLGITLLEIANGNHPFLPDKNGRTCSYLVSNHFIRRLWSSQSDDIPLVSSYIFSINIFILLRKLSKENDLKIAFVIVYKSCQ